MTPTQPTPLTPDDELGRAPTASEAALGELAECARCLTHINTSRQPHNGPDNEPTPAEVADANT